MNEWFKALSQVTETTAEQGSIDPSIHAAAEQLPLLALSAQSACDGPLWPHACAACLQYGMDDVVQL